jgi:hypothetical protein
MRPASTIIRPVAAFIVAALYVALCTSSALHGPLHGMPIDGGPTTAQVASCDDAHDACGAPGASCFFCHHGQATSSLTDVPFIAQSSPSAIHFVGPVTSGARAEQISLPPLRAPPIRS